MPDNYALALEQARLYFLKQNQLKILTRPGVIQEEGALVLPFLGTPAKVDRATGHVFCQTARGEWKPAGFSEALSIYDWLCDQQEDAEAAGEYCPVHSLPGVLVRGKGLTISGGKLAEVFDRHPERLHSVCGALGGEAVAMGDVGYRLPLFPGLRVLLKFYHSDEDFPPSLLLLWDRNILRFIRYETVYYVAGVLLGRMSDLATEMDTVKPEQENTAHWGL